MFDQTRRILTMIYEFLEIRERGRNSNFPTRSGTIGDKLKKKSKVIRTHSCARKLVI